MNSVARQTLFMPTNQEAEQGLLGALLVHNASYDKVSDFLHAEHFSVPVNGRIYAAIGKILSEGKSCSAVILKKAFENDEDLVEVGAGSYIHDLMTNVVTIMSVEEHARAIVDLAQRRDLIVTCDKAIGTASRVEPGVKASAIVTQTEADLYDIIEGTAEATHAKPFSSAIVAALTSAEAAYRRDPGSVGVSTGLVDLDKIMGGLRSPDLVIVAGRPGMGKAQPLDSKILTSAGWKTMGDLCFGDSLASVDGKPSRVTGVYPQGEREVFKVTFSDGRSTKCCGDHLWRVDSCKFGKGPRIVTTDELRAMLGTERYQRRVYIPLVDGDFGSSEPLPVDPWLLGVLIGNGTLCRRSPMVSTMDAATLYRVQSLLDDGMRATAIGDYDYRLSRPHGAKGENPLRSALVDLGLADKTSENKFIPSLYLEANRAARLELLRGLIDTDGWVEKFGAIQFSTSSERLAADVTALVRSLGGLCRTRKRVPKYSYKGQKLDGKPHFTCSISHRDPQSLMTLSRKKRRAITTKQPRLTIVSIESVGVEPVQCIKVSHPDSLYVTDDYIVTHNTALAAGISWKVAALDVPVGFFSLEMSDEQLATRIIGSEAGISSDAIRRGDVNADQFRKMTEAAQRLASLPLHIDDSAAQSLIRMRNAARRLKRREGLGLIVVDYLQLIHTPSRERENRVQELTAITKGLKEMAKEFEVPVIALSQLSRAVELRDDKRPQLSDLRESGSIEQDADIVLFTYREEYYAEREEPSRKKDETQDHFNERFANWQQRRAACANKAEAIVAKNRHGAIGTAYLHFDGPTTTFSNVAAYYSVAGGVR